MAAGASSTRASTRSGAWSASHRAVFPPKDVPMRLKVSRPRRETAWAMVDASSGMLRVRLFSGDWPNPGISKATTRKWRARRSCAGVTRKPPAPWRWTSGAPCPASMYRIRKPSASTKSSRKAVCATVGIPFSLISDIANAGQHRLPEQVQRAHERVQVAGARRVQGQVEHAGADHVATAPDLLDNRVRAPDERGGERAAHDGRPRFSGDVSGIQRHEGVADARAHGEGRLVRLLPQQRLGLVVGLGHEHVRPIEDLLRRRRPAVTRALLAVVPRGLAHDLERPVGDAAAEVMARRELAGFSTRAERVGGRMGLLERARPHRDGAELEVAALPAE